MPHFVNINQLYYLSTNYKVMFSKFNNDSSFVSANNKELVVNSFKNRYLAKKLNHYMIVRHPLKRLLSCYKDKFINNPSRYNEAGFQWQPSQKMFFDVLQIAPSQSHEEISNSLQNVSFKQFVNLLPLISLKEGHIKQQYKLMKVNYKSINWNLKFDKILKMEAEEDMKFLQDILMVDMTVKRNYTKKIEIDLSLTSKERTIINKLYKKDFQQFKYDFL